MSKSALKILFLCFVLISALAACQPEAKPGNCPPFETENVQISSDTAKLLDEMNNREVIWIGDYSGLHPRELTGATLKLNTVQEDIAPYLFDALLDEDKFVAAHILLTERSSSSFYGIGGLDWNGLVVHNVEGDNLYEGNFLHALQDFWCQKAIELISK